MDLELQQLSLFSSLQHEFMPYKDVWHSPSHLRRDKTRLKYSAILRRFNIPSSHHTQTTFSELSPIAMWIADMDIPPCAYIISAVSNNLRSTYGYQSCDIGDAVATWYERSRSPNYNYKVENTDIVDVASVISAVDVALRTFCQSGDKVMVLTPTYEPLTSSIKRNGLKPVYIRCTESLSSPKADLGDVSRCQSLVKDDSHAQACSGDNTERAARSSIDLSSLDKSATAFVICHPNNPTGTVLSRVEQQAVFEFCLQHNILLITDEVHSEFAFNSADEPTIISMFGLDNQGEVNKLDSQTEKYKKPSVLPRAIHLNSVSKAFNLASIPGASYAVIKDKQTRETFAEAISAKHLNASNLGKIALIAAYSEGSTWLDEVKAALSFNRKLVKRFFQHYGISVKFTMGRAGYFLWLDLKTFNATCSHSSLSSSMDSYETVTNNHTRGQYPQTSNDKPASIKRSLPLYYSPARTVEDCIERGVIGNDGAPFGAPDHIRLNIACHPALIEEALLRLCFIPQFK
ncbi:aminotransferase class I/II-fold pyridoxal phosphate-dependent enzyme [Alteromonas mediterranea]|uniref:aminotransferase class I/II-fold pyridoxal phosphate-dependent enzyme n=1 Tax=Alteromonas mediterranea TaxID=314275 RepID=UPI00241E4486|nr:aminotransferase class I/II-fold pyridoxal phosphate-dependent enzyme [Alteromonas mediterranea]